MAQAFKDLHWRRDIPLKEYLVPETLSEALRMLGERKGRARTIAGGTDVIVELRKRDYEVDALVDISRIPGMGGIDLQGDDIIIGALATHAQVAASPLIKEKAGLLASACAAVGSPQIRGIATVAGNLVSGRPAADSSIPLLALDARVTIASTNGDRVVKLQEFFLDLGKTAVDPSREILTRIEFKPLGPNQGCSFQRLSKRKALALPMLVCAVVVTTDPAKQAITESAIALGPVAPVPFRDKHIEDLIKGKPATLQTLQEASENTCVHCSPRGSLLRGSSEYRQEMVKVLVKRGLRKALEQAGCTL
ncbi:MAG: FAD binding domain-containing protein [Desulfomonile tiedjei]|nr:FAD binding domain-containing protein [Desulfomonile tiedjei]